MIKGYKIRLYPTKIQEDLMWQHIYGCRYVWNYMFALQEERYKNKESYLSEYQMMKLLPLLKNDGEHNWLKQLSSGSLKCVCTNLDNAYKLFFRSGKRHPKFKTKKHSKNRFPARQDSMYFCEDSKVQIEKIGKIKYKTDFNIPIGKEPKFMNPYVFLDDNKWYLSFSMEVKDKFPSFNR